MKISNCTYIIFAFFLSAYSVPDLPHPTEPLPAPHSESMKLDFSKSKVLKQRRTLETKTQFPNDSEHNIKRIRLKMKMRDNPLYLPSQQTNVEINRSSSSRDFKGLSLEAEEPITNTWTYPQGTLTASSLNDSISAASRQKIVSRDSSAPTGLFIIGDLESELHANKLFSQNRAFSVAQLADEESVTWTPERNMRWLQEHINRRGSFLTVSDESALYRQKDNPYPEHYKYTLFLAEMELLARNGYQRSPGNSLVLVPPEHLPDDHKHVALIDTTRLPEGTMDQVKEDLDKYLYWLASQSRDF